MVQAAHEERSAKRFKLRNFTLRYSTGNLFSFMKKGKGEEHPLINMSATGLAFVTPESMPAQTPIKVVLEGSLFEQPLDLRGEVVYCHQLGRQAMYRIGVIFDGKQARKSSDLLEGLDQTVGAVRMRVLCAHCGMVIKVKRKHEGKTTRCPRCEEPVKLVEPTEEDDSAEGTEKKVIEAVGSMAEEETSASGTRLDISLRRIVEELAPNPTALAVLEEITSPDQTQDVSTALVAKKVGQPAYRVGTALKRLVDVGLLKFVEPGLFNLEPSDETAVKVEQLREALEDAQLRLQIEAELR